MSFAAVSSHLVLVVTAAVLFYMALTDLRHYTIRNELVLVLGFLFLIHSLLSGHWVTIHWNIGFATVMFIIMLALYSRGLIGGGDVKLLAIAFLWVGIDCALPFAFLLLAFVGMQGIAVKLGWVETQAGEGGSGKRMPFAPAVAGALIGVFLSGCLAPVS
jgi:prepilin peptidase CpaA